MNIAVSGRYLVYHPLGAGVSFSRRIEGESERERLARPCRATCWKAASCCAPPPPARPPDVLQADAAQVMERWETDPPARPSTSQPPADLSARIPGERDPIARMLRDHGASPGRGDPRRPRDGARAAGRDGPPRGEDPRALAQRADAGLRHRRRGGPDRHRAGAAHRAAERRRGAVRAGRDAVRDRCRQRRRRRPPGPRAAPAGRGQSRGGAGDRPAAPAAQSSRAPW